MISTSTGKIDAGAKGKAIKWSDDIETRVKIDPVVFLEVIKELENEGVVKVVCERQNGYSNLEDDCFLFDCCSNLCSP